ncbi:SET domain-containing protein [Calocera viscosa TUFC12733]|uniref:SET domain-containing protein n=1 Tax=Calocera viscosa (strain TUFC12733) TaxID=1330018 RepID=A0A167MBS2_CALVF|nr:SET domain-containing protein [Calocera viscosa TUFC12733]
MVATRNIEAGTFVLREQPLLVACMDARFNSSVSLAGLKTPRREKLSVLYNSARGMLGMSELHGIVATNAVGIALPPDGEDHLAVCEFASRINHSCIPNARYYWDNDNFAVGLVTTQHIRAGTEITITYIDPFLPHLDREAHLLSNYGFSCNCLACQKDSPTYRLSETVRTTVNNLLPDVDGEGDDDLVRWGGNTKAFVQRILNMLEVEGLQGERAEVIVRFAEFEQRLGNKERAQRMARWALRELAKIEIQDASPDWAAMREIIQG